MQPSRNWNVVVPTSIGSRIVPRRRTRRAQRHGLGPILLRRDRAGRLIALIMMPLSVASVSAEEPPRTASNAGMELAPPAATSAPAEFAAARVVDRPVKRNVGDEKPTDSAVALMRPKESLPWYRSGLAPLFMVLAVMVALAVAAKRWLRPAYGGGSDCLAVWCRLPLSPKQSLALVQLGGRLAFVGISADRITTLRLVNDPQEAASLRARLRPTTGAKPGRDFDQWLARTSREFQTAEPAPPAAAGQGQRLTETRKELGQLLERLRSS